MSARRVAADLTPTDRDDHVHVLYLVSGLAVSDVVDANLPDLVAARAVEPRRDDRVPRPSIRTELLPLVSVYAAAPLAPTRMKLVVSMPSVTDFIVRCVAGPYWFESSLSGW
jgi:hypothetical protein